MQFLLRFTLLLTMATPILAQDRSSTEKPCVQEPFGDAKLVIDHTDVILRSTDFPKMKFNQSLLTPYFVTGLHPKAQKTLD